jgi:DNA-binding NarL/FixJ family response regulator
MWPQGPCPFARVFLPSSTVAIKRMSTKLTVCLLSPHPLVLSEFERLLAKASQFRVIPKQLESTLAPDLRSLDPPKAQVYVIDAHAARQATGALLTNILERYPDARLIVVGDSVNESASFSLLRLGVKGILSYAEARDQLFRALPLVSQGGFWVPRSVLSGFVDSILTSQGRRLKTDAVTNLSRREQEVLDSLLENLSNKEIASKLNIAERTVKFHVSNLLNKFGVRRRADLILLTFQRRLASTQPTT